MLTASALPAFGQYGSDKPHPDSTVVWFYPSEAAAIHDSLWERLSDRERRVIAHQMLMNQRAATASAERQAEQATEQMRAALKSAAVYREDYEAELNARQQLQLKTKGKGTRGFLWGLGVGVAGTITAIILAP